MEVGEENGARKEDERWVGVSLTVRKEAEAEAVALVEGEEE